ncbi:hypothetical protein K450DRAFT_230994 [Umbelopsis ramanniana AG]|uniref:Cyclin N-terminal domain-containing protein n=1 Tax=Umbelopsis ramanniana AG TaxID=1314678 RepID=A0AAD5HG49_UMBRA|nr:uncharacterized protein K450DRAFT_230994 [Umbelopsis ramanniana AG]KAI8581759.1 hypothetical protein K450DRAFT_230994 [Umbelopsis ramanniana AG]
MSALALASMEQLVKQPINSKITLLVVDKLREAIRCSNQRLEDSFTRRRASPLYEVLKSINAPYVPPLSVFIKDLVRRSNVSTGTVIVSLVYIDRLQKKLPEATQGIHCACHRVFLAALILSAKTLNDSSPKNRHWARYANCFPLAEVNLMERQLFLLLDYDLSVSENDLLEVCMPLIDLPIPTTSVIPEYALPKPVNYDETKFIDCYLGESMDAANDSAYSSDSEITSSHSLLADLELIPTNKNQLSHGEVAVEQWDAIW